MPAPCRVAVTRGHPSSVCGVKGRNEAAPVHSGMPGTTPPQHGPERDLARPRTCADLGVPRLLASLKFCFPLPVFPNPDAVGTGLRAGAVWLETDFHPVGPKPSSV